MHNIAVIKPLSIRGEATIAGWTLVGRLLLFSLFVWSLFIAFKPDRAFAHATDPDASANPQAYQGLLANIALCGSGGYQLVDTVLCTHGPDLPPQLDEVKATHALLATAPTASISCVGDGVSGKRVQVMYVRTITQPDRYATVAPQLLAVTTAVDALYEASAQETAGHRRIRFVTTPTCQLDIMAIELPVNATNSFAATVTALRTLGYDDPDRKYLLFVDAEIYCGVSTVKKDSQPGPANANNQLVGYARIDRGCWNVTTVAHELTHTLGGVQNDAPHATGGWHCTDQYDLMCYADSENSPPITIGCANISHENLLDCNHDDYFHTNPPADNYLASHWNVANSDFLLNLPNGHPATGQLVLAPANGVTELTPSTAISVAVTALTAASLTNDYIQSVKFFQDGVLMDVATTAPYHWTWPGASAFGAYVLTVEIDTHDDVHIITQPLIINVKPAAAIMKTVYLPVVIK